MTEGACTRAAAGAGERERPHGTASAGAASCTELPGLLPQQQPSDLPSPPPIPLEPAASTAARAGGPAPTGVLAPGCHPASNTAPRAGGRAPTWRDDNVKLQHLLGSPRPPHAAAAVAQRASRSGRAPGVGAGAILQLLLLLGRGLGPRWLWCGRRQHQRCRRRSRGGRGARLCICPTAVRLLAEPALHADLLQKN